LKGRTGDRFEQVATQVERTDLRQREARLQAVQDAAVQPPSDAPAVVALVEQREARFLERRQVAADRAGGDVELVGQAVDGGAVPRRLEGVEEPPLADDFLIARHAPIVNEPRLTNAP
jgi:hypothetical protein